MLREAAGTECCLLAGAGPHFRSYRHRAELCTDHTHAPELAKLKGEAAALAALLPIRTTLPKS